MTETLFVNANETKKNNKVGELQGTFSLCNEAVCDLVLQYEDKSRRFCDTKFHFNYVLACIILDTEI